MLDIKIDNPGMLFLLLLLPIYIYYYIKSIKFKRDKLKEFSAINFIEFYKYPRLKKHSPFVMSLLAVLFLIFSITNPKVQGSVVTEEKILILALDVSKSMASDDVAPSRFEAAIQTAKDFLNNVPNGYKVGLVTFSGTGQVLSIPTANIDLIRTKLNNLKLENGTATGDALVLALSQFGDNTKGGVIVLISDGRQTAGITTIEVASGALLAAGVKAYTIALGTPTGRIVINDPDNPDAMDEIFSVPPDPVGMARIATITGGQTFSAFSIKDLNNIYKSVSGKLNVEQGWVSVSWLTTMISFILFIFSAILQKRFLIS